MTTHSSFEAIWQHDQDFEMASEKLGPPGRHLPWHLSPSRQSGA